MPGALRHSNLHGRTYLVLTPPDRGKSLPNVALTTRSGVEALNVAHRVGGWVEGDDRTTIWPQHDADGELVWEWSRLRRWGEL